MEQGLSREIAGDPSTKPTWYAADQTIRKRFQAKERNGLSQLERPNAWLTPQAAWQEHRGWQSRSW